MSRFDRMREAMLRFFDLFPFFSLDEYRRQQQVQQTVEREIRHEQNFMERELLRRQHHERT